jgi:predicted transcriptional regulator
MEDGTSAAKEGGGRERHDLAPPSLGDQELEVLQFVEEHAPATVRDVAEGYGVPRKLSRSTVVTVMERLRQKGYLIRRRRNGIFHYAPRIPASEAIQGMVRRFVETTLGGSVSPVVAYLVRGDSLSEEDLRNLEGFVQDLKAKREEAERCMP